MLQVGDSSATAFHPFAILGMLLVRFGPLSALYSRSSNIHTGCIGTCVFVNTFTCSIFPRVYIHLCMYVCMYIHIQ